MRNAGRIQRFTRLNLALPLGAPALAELALFLALVGADLWLLAERPALVLVARAAALAVVFGSLWRRRLSFTGPALIPAGKAWREAGMVTLLIIVAVVAWAMAVRETYDEIDLGSLSLPLPAAVWIARRLGLVALQQVGMHLFLAPLTRQLLRREGATVLVVAVFVGLFHLPGLALAAATAIAAALWMVLYRRGRRLLPLVASHIVLVVVASSALPPRVLPDLSVGSRAQQSVHNARFLARDEVRTLLRGLTAPAYFEHRGGAMRRWIAGLYVDLYGRPATPGELDYWVGQSHGSSRSAIAKQMLFSEELDRPLLSRRRLDYGPIDPGVRILAADSSAVFEGWQYAEEDVRWAASATPAIRFRLDSESQRTYLLELKCVARGSQPFWLSIDGQRVGSGVCAGGAPQRRRFAVSGGLLGDGGESEVRIQIELETGASDEDRRSPDFGFGSLRLEPLRFPAACIAFPDEDYFLDGFSIAEASLRWTQAPSAQLVYPLRQIHDAAAHLLEIEGGVFERQPLEVLVNGHVVARWDLEGMTPVTHRTEVDAAWLREGANLIEFRLPAARRPPGDPRLLGLALVSVRLFPSP